MEIKKAYRLRLYPTSSQEQRLIEIVGGCRFVWNYYLEKRKMEYLENKKSMNYHACAKDLTSLKKQTEYLWLKNIPSQALQQSLRNLEIAYVNFFKKRARYPRFKSKHNIQQSFRMPTVWKLKGNKIQIQKGVLIRARGTFPIGTLKSITIIRISTGKWFASIVTEQIIKPKKKTGKPIGIDLGIKYLAVTSEGKRYENIRPRKTSQAEIKKLSQSLSRKQKGSNRRAKAKLELSRLHEKISNQRMNHLHQTSHRITSENQAVIVCEDLSVKNMMQNHRLAGSIADVSWGEFIRQLEYKQEWTGGKLVKIDRFFPSSKTCSDCGFILESLNLWIREWTCPKCGSIHDRDINAAKNILQQEPGNDSARRVQRISGKLEKVTGSMKR